MTEETKKCGRCGEEKSLFSFYSGDRYCKNCRREYQSEWNRENRPWLTEKAKAKNRRYKKRHRDKIRMKDREYQLERVYGITPEEYDTLLAQQEGHCAGCKATEYNNKSYHLAVDHNHDTGEIRGLLCLRCNRILGLSQDDPGLLHKLADYLERSG